MVSTEQEICGALQIVRKLWKTWRCMCVADGGKNQDFFSTFTSIVISENV